MNSILNKDNCLFLILIILEMVYLFRKIEDYSWLYTRSKQDIILHTDIEDGYKDVEYELLLK